MSVDLPLLGSIVIQFGVKRRGFVTNGSREWANQIKSVCLTDMNHIGQTHGQPKKIIGVCG